MSPLSPLSKSQDHHSTTPGDFPLDLLPGLDANSTHDQPDNAQNEEIHDSPLQNADIGNISPLPRYQLRRRAPAQLKPYTVEKYQYKQLLSENPDAIVKHRDPTHASNEHYDHADDHVEESQALWRPNDDADQYSSDGGLRPNRKTSLPSNGPSRAHVPSATERAQYPEILQGLPSTDEEEAKDLRETSKEARKIARERKAKERREAKEKMKSRHQAKSYPFKESLNVSPPRTEARWRLDPLSLSSVSMFTQGHSESQHASPSGESDDIHSPVKTIPRTSSSPSAPLNGPEASGSYPPSSTPFRDDVHSVECHNDVQGDILSDNEIEVSQSSDAEREDAELRDTMSKKEKKQVKTLGRLYPAFMMKLLAKGSQSRKSRTKRATSELSGSEEEDNPELLPGQTRTGWSKNTWDVKEIKGDSESSDDERSSVADSMSDMVSRRSPSEPDLRRWRDDGRSSPDAMELTDSSDDGMDDGVDYEQIQAYMHDEIGSTKAISGGSRREPTLIDYMLSKTRIVHHQPRPKNRKRSSAKRARRQGPTSSKFKIYGATRGARGAGNERQTTLLNFHRHAANKPSNHDGRRRHQPASLSRRAPSDVEDYEVCDDRDHVHPAPALEEGRKKSWKEKERDRRARAKGNGLHTFASDSTHVVTGRRETAMFTIDIEAEGSRRRIVPRFQDWTIPFQPALTPSVAPKQPPSKRLPTPDPDHGVDDDVVPAPLLLAKSRSITVDLDISALHSGISFGVDTYIGKGWLSELIAVIRSQMPPPMPATVTFRDIELGPSTSINSFTESLAQIFKALLDVVTSLVGIESAEDEQEWRRVQRVAAQLLSWLLATAATEADTKLLRDCVQEQTLKFVSSLRDLDLKAPAIDTFTLSVSWFTVELSARLGLSSPTSASPCAFVSTSLLVDYLLECGFEPTMLTILDEGALDSSTTARYVAELWVSLFHLTGSQHVPGQLSKQHTHPFLLVVKKALMPTHNPQKPVLEASEAIWHTIFSLCALTQFSVHGMTTSESRLPACWDLVLQAMKGIRLEVDDDIDSKLRSFELRKRDKYTGIVIHRCFRLWNHWHWQLDNTSDLFSHLSAIFRTRKFACFRHEPPEYPSFFLQNDWSQLSKYDPQDTGFVVFLKLLVQAVGCDETNANRGLSPKAKKLLSLAIPVGSLPFSKKTPEIVQDLTMLYNRFSALAIAIYLDPTHHDARISHARKYDDFIDANDTTRIAVIRGMMYFAIMLKNAKLSMEGIKGWIQGIATILVNEFKGLVSEQAAVPEDEWKIKHDRVCFTTQLLIGSVREIIKAYELTSEYPEPMLLASLEPLFKGPQSFIDLSKTADEIRKMVQTFLDARKLVLPPPQRPRIMSQRAAESQESQDEYGTVDMDYDDPDLVAALSGDPGAEVTPGFTAKEAAMKSLIDSRFVWWAWRNLNKRVPDPAPPVKDDLVYINRWLDCWLGSMDGIGCDDESFEAGPYDLRGQKSDNASNLCIRADDCLQIYQDVYLGTLMTALASTRPKFERDFVALLLSIDGCQHPLLLGLSMDTTDVTIDDQSKEKGPKDILRVILHNLDRQLQQEAMGDRSTAPDGEKYVGFCIKMFQAMQGNLSELEVGSEARREYVAWCGEIFLEIIPKHQELRVHSRLTHWMAWGRDLS
ncbi:Mus7/MMS22 family-domain-containing protein [Lyophyllum atratum]|nr:Mus7/MMS22 family-domain-containing protein [Lyophyllum atratum]